MISGTVPRAASAHSPTGVLGVSQFAENLDQELSVICVGEKLNLVNFVGHCAFPPHLPEGCDGAINQRRTYRTLLNRKQFVGAEFVVAERELRRRSSSKASAVAVVPGRRRMNRDLRFQLQLGNAAKSLFQDRGLDLQLMLVAGVLVMAAATATEVRTAGLYPLGGSLQNRLSTAPCKASLLFEQRSLDSFAFQHKGHENSFAGTVLVGREAGEAVSAINEFFNGELQARILSWKPSAG